MWQICKKNLIDNRAKYAHFLAVFAGVIASKWASDPSFRSAMEQNLTHLPHWMQGLVGFLAFVIPLYKTTRKLITPAAEVAQ